MPNSHNFWIFPEFVLEFAIQVLDISTKMAFSQNTQHLNLFCTCICSAPRWCFARTPLSGEHLNGIQSEHFIFVIFWCQDGSRPNLIGLYERAFHKDSESGLNSKMVIGTQMSFIQNTAVIGLNSPVANQKVLEAHKELCKKIMTEVVQIFV